MSSVMCQRDCACFTQMADLLEFTPRFLNKLLLSSGHFTKDCFSAPGLQYALLPEEDDKEPEQQPSTAAQNQDSDKKKKKKVTM